MLAAKDWDSTDPFWACSLLGVTYRPPKGVDRELYRAPQGPQGGPGGGPQGPPNFLGGLFGAPGGPQGLGGPFGTILEPFGNFRNSAKTRPPSGPLLVLDFGKCRTPKARDPHIQLRRPLLFRNSARTLGFRKNFGLPTKRFGFFLPKTRNLGVHLPLGSLVLGSLLGGLFGVVVDSLVGSSCLLGNNNHKGGAKRPRAAAGSTCGCSCGGGSCCRRGCR